MIIYQNIKWSDLETCAYLPDRRWRFEYFFARKVTAPELEALLASGWRKFGIYYFRIACPDCRECRPIRVLSNELLLSKSQRRVMRKNRNTQVHFGPLRHSPEIYQIYCDHSWNRFRQHSSLEEFLRAHYYKSCPGLQAEYYLDDKLIAVGFLDRSDQGLSSSYLVYKTDFAHLSLGTYSVIIETQYAQKLNLRHYYLGYYIAPNAHMAYKNRFYNHEMFDWQHKVWQKKMT